MKSSEIAPNASEVRLGEIAFDSTRIVGPNSGRMTGYSEVIPSQEPRGGRMLLIGRRVRVKRKD